MSRLEFAGWIVGILVAGLLCVAVDWDGPGYDNIFATVALVGFVVRLFWVGPPRTEA